MTTGEAKSPDASDAGKTTKIGVLAPMEERSGLRNAKRRGQA